MKKQIALIGISGFGGTHLAHLLALAKDGLLDIAAVVIRSRELEAEQLALLDGYNTRVYLDAEEFFTAEAGKIDMVCLPTSIDSHEPFVIKALNAHMNVLVEKPVSGSVESVERMIAAEKASDRFVAVGFQHFYAPEMVFFRELLLSGRLGKIIDCAATACWPRNDGYYARNNWSAKRSVNGVQILDSPLNNACAHYLNILLFLNSTRRGVTAKAVDVSGKLLRARSEIEMFDTCDLLYTLENGATARTAFTHSCAEFDDARIFVACEKGAISWIGNSDWVVYDEEKNIIAQGKAVYPGETMFRRVVAKLYDPSVEVYTLANGLEHVRCVEMADKKCPIENVECEKINGVCTVKGIEELIDSRKLVF
jgi:predicted dehydrogenase